MSDQAAYRAQNIVPQQFWLRDSQFDLSFILGTAILAIASGLYVVANPKMFALVLFVDLWLLGYHHVISTYTRLCFDKESAEKNKFILFVLPVIVLVSVLALSYGIGLWVLTTIYLYWQWFHYTRQSWGISQGYRRKSGDATGESDQIFKAAFYLLPLWGILYRSYQAPDKFIGVDVVVIPTPGWLVTIVSAAAMISLILWIIQRVRSHLAGHNVGAHTIYMISHFAVFYVGYLYIEDITYGWLTINIWHNAQYILFVWLFNNKKFRNGIDPKAKFLSEISQNTNFWRYMLVCLSMSTVIYFSLDSASGILYSIGIPSMIIIFQTINFHHYITDSIIWKMRKPEMSKTLELKS